MNINLHSIGNINQTLLKNYGYKYNNLSPLAYDTVSFGAKKKTTVNVSWAKESIQKFQDPDFNVNGQASIPLDELINLLLYCGCKSENDGGKHSVYINTPLGQHYPISAHKVKEADIGLASSVINAVKNLDENYGEIIFEKGVSAKQLTELREKAKAKFNSAAIDSPDLNPYQVELKKKRTEQQEKISEAEKALNAEKVKQQKTDEANIKALTDSITSYTLQLDELLQYYEIFKEEVEAIIEASVQTGENKAFPENKSLDELREELKKELETKVIGKIENQTKQIQEDLDKTTPKEDDTIETLEEKFSTIINLPKQREEELDRFIEEAKQSIDEIIEASGFNIQLAEHMNTAIDIMNVLRQVKNTFKSLREDRKQNGDSQHLTIASKEINTAKKTIKITQEKFIKGEIDIQRAKEICEVAQQSVDSAYDNYSSEERRIISSEKSYVKNYVNRINKAMAALDDYKKQFSEIEKYAKKKDRSQLQSYIKEAEEIIRSYNKEISQKTICKYLETGTRNSELYNKLKDYSSSINEKIKDIIISLNKIKSYASLLQEQNIVEQTPQHVEPAVQNETEEKIPEQLSVEGKEEQLSDLDYLTLPESIFGISTKIFEKKAGPVSEEEKAEIKSVDDIEQEQTQLLQDKNNDAVETPVIAEEVQETELSEAPIEQTTKLEQEISQVQDNETKEIKELNPIPEEDKEVQQTQQETETDLKAEEVSAPQTHHNSEVKKSNEVKSSPYSMDFADKLIGKMAENIAVLPLYAVIEDLRYEISNIISTKEIKELQQASPLEYQELIKSKKKAIYSTAAVKQIKYAETFAILRDMEAVSKEDAKALYTSPFSKTKEAIKIMAQNKKYNNYRPTFSTLNSKYKNYMKLMNTQNINSIVKFLSDCFDADTETTKKLEKFISKQRYYCTELTNSLASKEFKTMMIKVLMAEFDKENGTNYSEKADSAIDNYQAKKLMEQKLDMLDNMDWNSDTEDDDSLF